MNTIPDEQKKEPEQNKEQILDTQLEKFNKNLIRFNSYKMVFLRGIISGVGGAIGATIIAALFISILTKTIQRMDVPFLNNLLETSHIGQMFDATEQGY